MTYQRASLAYWRLVGTIRAQCHPLPEARHYYFLRMSDKSADILSMRRCFAWMPFGAMKFFDPRRDVQAGNLEVIRPEAGVFIVPSAPKGIWVSEPTLSRDPGELISSLIRLREHDIVPAVLILSPDIKIKMGFFSETDAVSAGCAV